MLQFYFLSILLNLIVGLILIYADIFSLSESEKQNDSETKKESFTASLANSDFLTNKTFLLVVGLLSLFTGIMKLLSVVRNDIPVVGDLLPSLAGLIGGFSVLLAFYKKSATVEIKLPEIFQKIFISGHKYIGIFCIIAGLLHFIIPGVLFF